MLIGFDAPTRGPLATLDNMLRLVTEGEAMGYDYCTFSDHIVIPRDIHAIYPYSDTGEFPAGGRGDWHEQLTAIAFLAGKTSRLRLVTSVMVVPHRPAVLTAKILSTIDILSGGRLTVGCGAGWLREEFEAVGAPPFAERGAVTDEYLRAFRALWTEERPQFAGRYVRFADVTFAPKPTQKPHPPLWIGGESEPALRRAARLGDGWYPIGVNPQFPLDTLTRYRTRVERLRRLIAEAGRPASAVTLGYRSPRFGAGVPRTTAEGERRLFAGEARDLAEDVRSMRDLGVNSLDFGFASATLEETLAGMKRFRDDVLAKV
ncbi:MAG TPA: LLM class F420-dependent oxidoreductase [Candidatus Sulfotelmatobacter sp.]|nr:LLM class F420-dependent oxidoreductase [Candidatus Sulfotelmatobacter sp.]